MGLAIAALAVLSLGLSLLAWRRQEPLCWKFAVPERVDATDAPMFQTVFDYAPKTGQAHSPAIACTPTGFSLVWFQGSAEAQADVDIYASDFTQGGTGWQHSDPKPRLTRSAMGDAFDPMQLVVTLGNTIENEAVPGGFYATVVSLGGWAMASVANVRMGVGGPKAAHKLNLSPLLNRSHLVKSPMLAMADGSHALPAYFEMGRTYSVLVRLHADGRVRDTRRLPGHHVKAIQPMIVPLDETRAVAFMRDFDSVTKRLLVSRTLDGGQSWSKVEQSEIENPGAPVAMLALGGGNILMAVNDDAARSDILRLTLSGDGGNSWRRIATLEDAGGDLAMAVRYPMLRRLPGGEIALTYSHSSKGGVRAHVFNEAWVMAQ